MSEQLKPGDIRWFYTEHTVHVCRLVELTDFREGGRVHPVWLVSIIRDDGTWTNNGYALLAAHLFPSRGLAFEAGEQYRKRLHQEAIEKVVAEHSELLDKFITNAKRDAEREEAALAAMNEKGGE